MCIVKMGDGFAPDMESSFFYNQLNEKVCQHMNPCFDPVLREVSRPSFKTGELP